MAQHSGEAMLIDACSRYHSVSFPGSQQAAVHGAMQLVCPVSLQKDVGTARCLPSTWRGAVAHVFDAHGMHEVLIRLVCCRVRLSSTAGIHQLGGARGRCHPEL
jgi:hypothetical protein